MTQSAKPKRKQVKIGALTYARLIKAMIPGDLTCQELADETGLHLLTVYQYTRELHAAGAAHIARYDTDCRGRSIIKVFKLGEGRDAKRQPMSKAERQQRVRDRVNTQRHLAVAAGRGRFVAAANGRLRFEEVLRVPTLADLGRAA